MGGNFVKPGASFVVTVSSYNKQGFTDKRTSFLHCLEKAKLRNQAKNVCITWAKIGDVINALCTGVYS